MAAQMIRFAPPPRQQRFPAPQREERSGITIGGGDDGQGMMQMLALLQFMSSQESQRTSAKLERDMFELQKGTVRTERQETLRNRLAGETTEKTLFCCDTASVAAELKERLGANAVLPSPTTGLRRAAFLAELGLKRLQAGDVDDAATLQPVYLRRPSITTAQHR